MTLDPEFAIKPAADAIRIESPSADAPAATISPPKPKTERTTQPVNSNTANTNGCSPVEGNGHATASAAPANGQPVNRIRRKVGRRDTPGLIEHAEQLRTALRETLLKTNDLIKAIKQDRRQSRAVQQTLAQLRQLKTLGV